VRPVLHWSLTLQPELGVHDTQLPLLQKRLLPQEVPLGTLLAASVQTGLPLAHESRPLWHLFEGVQDIPSAQVSQLPSRQTRPAPQPLPFF